MSHREKLSARMTLSIPPSLLKALHARARAMNIDTPSLARVALAIVAEQGLKLEVKAKGVDSPNLSPDPVEPSEEEIQANEFHLKQHGFMEQELWQLLLLLGP